MMNIGNPLLAREKVMRSATGEALTINGVINKTGFMLATLMMTFGYVWHLHGIGMDVMSYVTWGGIIGLVLALVIIFAQIMNPIVILAYSACEGLMLGGLSAHYEVLFPGIVMQASLLTLGCFCGIWLAYRMGIVRYTPGFAKFLMVAIGGIMLTYLASFICGFFGIQFSFLHDSSPLSIGISIFVVIIATLSFVMDFASIEWAAENRVSKEREWYCAFGLVVTLVWLYLEMLRLLSKLRNR